MNRLVFLIFAAVMLSLVSCKEVTYGGRTEVEDLADRVVVCHKYLVYNLDYVFQANRYMAAEDSAQLQEVLYKYFENSEIEYDTTAGVLYIYKYRGFALSIETGGKPLGPDNNVWKVEGTATKPWGDGTGEEYSFEVRLLEDGRYGFYGTIIANRFLEPQFMYEDVDLEFLLGWVEMPYYHPEVSVRETATYRMNGTVDMFVGEYGVKEKETPEFRSTFSSVYGYDPHEYVDSEPIFAGGSYLQGGEIRSILSYDDRQDEYLNLFVNNSGVARVEHGIVE